MNNALGMELPTRADMEEIEISSRLYTENGALFMTALMLANSGTEKPAADVVTFVLARKKLITFRYIDPQPFRTFEARCGRSTVRRQQGRERAAGLIDVIIDRLADIQERASVGDRRHQPRNLRLDARKHPITSREFQKMCCARWAASTT